MFGAALFEHQSGRLSIRLPPSPFLSQTSTSLQHVPYDLAAEPSLPASPPRPLAFAVQKLRELSAAAAALRR